MNAITRILLVGALTVAGTSVAFASSPSQLSATAIELVDLSYYVADAPELQRAHYRSYRHRHRGYRGYRHHRPYRSRGFHSRRFGRYGYYNRHRGLGFGYRYYYYPRYYDYYRY